MKIEMGESLALSWLRHVKKCSIVQANWKPSFEWEERDDCFVEQVLQEAHEYFEEHGFPVLPYEKGRHTVDAYKVLMQTECDGIGVKVGRGTSGDEYFAIESAFHADGLHYGKAPKDTATKVAEKMVRIALALYYFMGVTKAHVYFAAPKITRSFFEPVQKAFKLVSEFFRRPVFVEKGVAFDFKLLLNAPADAEGSTEFGNRFNDEILWPVKRRLPIIDDTAELFVRALGMNEICTAHCNVSGSNLRRALKSLGIKFEKFLRRCETFKGVEQMLNDLDDEGGNRAKAILDYVSNMNWNELGLKKKLSKRDIERRAHVEEGPQEIRENQKRDVGTCVNNVVITLDPSDPKEFKEKLLKKKMARRIRQYANGLTEEDVWHADSFKEDSDLMGNIKSSAVYRTAIEKGIARISYHV